MICPNQVDVRKDGGTMQGRREVLNMKNRVLVE